MGAKQVAKPAAAEPELYDDNLQPVAADEELYDDNMNPVAGHGGATVRPLARAGAANPDHPFADLGTIHDAGESFMRGAVMDDFLSPAQSLHQAGMQQVNDTPLTPGAYAWGVLKALGHGVTASMQSEENKAADDIVNADKGDVDHPYLRAFGHHLAGSLAFLGPVAGQLADLATNPDDEQRDAPRAAGQAFGMAVPELMGNVGSRLGDITPPAAGDASLLERSKLGFQRDVFDQYRTKQHEAAKAEYAKASSDLGKQYAADVAASEQQMRRQYGSQLVDRANKIDAAHADFQKLHEGLITSARNEAQKISTLSAPADIGSAAADSILNKKDTAQELYDKVTEATGDVTVPMDGLKSIAQKYQTMLEARSALLDPKGLSEIQQQLSRIIEGPDEVGYAAASGAATDLLDTARQIDSPLPNLRGKINAEIATELKKATNKAVADADPAVGKSLNTANKLWVDIHKPAVQELLDRVHNGKPETVHEILTAPSTSIQDLRDIKQVVSPAAWRSMSARVLSDAIEDSLKTKTLTNPAAVNAGTRTVQQLGDSITNLITDLDRSGKLKELFPDTADKLKELVELSKKNRTIPASKLPRAPKMGTADVPKPDVEGTLGPKPEKFTPPYGLSARLLDMSLAGAGTYVIFKRDLSSITSAAVVQTTMYGLAKLMTEPAGVNKLVGYMRAVAEGNAPRAATLGTQIAFLAHKQRLQDAADQKAHAEITATIPSNIIPHARTPLDYQLDALEKRIDAGHAANKPDTEAEQQYDELLHRHTNEAGIAQVMEDHHLTRQQAIDELTKRGLLH